MKLSEKVKELADKHKSDPVESRVLAFLAQLKTSSETITSAKELELSDSQLEGFQIGIFVAKELFMLNFKLEIDKLKDEHK